VAFSGGGRVSLFVPLDETYAVCVWDKKQLRGGTWRGSVGYGVLSRGGFFRDWAVFEDFVWEDFHDEFDVRGPKEDRGAERKIKEIIIKRLFI